MNTRRELANAIRALSMDAVQLANSGHPGAPMGMADIAEVLWRDYLRFNPKNPDWMNRDRFVLSNGHGSMLIYALLHLSGYALTLEDIKQFRQLDSATPGHPEVGDTPGVETTTGPLGQGLANAVGMALSEKLLGTQFNRPGFPVIDHFTYVFAGDGCMMEGISHEACSLAGTLGLGKLIVIYDDNGISIDGEVDGWFTEDIPKRFTSYGWQVIADVDGHDAEAVTRALDQARADTSKPCLIQCKTVIGFGSPNKQGKESSHGAPLGEDEIAAAREQLNWTHPPFEIPQDIASAWDASERGAQLEKDWNNLWNDYQQQYADLASELKRRIAGELPADWREKANQVLKTIVTDEQTVATRKASQIALEGYCNILPEMLGGSADLTGSNNTNWSGSKPVTADSADGNYIYYGVREFGMSAIMNGIALYGGFIPYGGTFLTFSDYARNAVRMAALMRVRSIFVYTHDSIGLGEDGPTHQAVEHTSSLRLIPNLQVWRPCDTTETAIAWKCAVEQKRSPTALILSRQNAPFVKRTAEQLALIHKGGYILRDCDGAPDIILLATGTEVHITLEAAKELASKGIQARVVSMPCCEIFDQQDAAYRESVLPDSVRKRVAVEAGVTTFWRSHVGLDGEVVGMDSFGKSAPGGKLMKYYGFTVENVVQTATRLCS